MIFIISVNDTMLCEKHMTVTDNAHLVITFGFDSGRLMKQTTSLATHQSSVIRFYTDISSITLKPCHSLALHILLMFLAE